MADSDGPSVQSCSCKVGAVAAEFGLDDIDETLRQAWTASDGPSVRTLAARFNKRVLRAAFHEAGRLPLDGEIDNVYRILTDDETADSDRTRARQRLKRDGIAIAEVEDHLVSHQTLYRHLVECLDASHDEPEKSDDERIDDWRRRLRALQSRTTSVTARGIEQLRTNGAVDIGSFDVVLEATVTCEDCGTFYTLEEFLDARTCDCQPTTDERL